MALPCRSMGIKRLDLAFRLDDRSRRDEQLIPAVVTADRQQISGLLALRLSGMTLSAGVRGIRLRALGRAQKQQQMDLFDRASWDVAAGQQALAEVRAALGDDAVACAAICDGHLPQAQFEWVREPGPSNLDSVKRGTRGRNERTGQAEMTEHVAVRPLVRRFLNKPRMLRPPPREKTEDWWVLGLQEEPVEEIVGPCVISEGWWRSDETSRAYYYLRIRGGRWLWVFFDQRRKAWFQQGEVM